jgi:hypothetical protein
MMLRTYKKAPDDVFCPIVNGSKRFFRRPMSKTCPTCPFWTAITGQPTTSHEAVDLGWVCSEQGQFQSQVDIARRLMGRESAVESERNMLVHAFNQQAEAQQHISQQIGSLTEATQRMAVGLDERMALPLTHNDVKALENHSA